MTKPDDFIIGGHRIKAGTKTTLSLPIPKLHDWTSFSLPVHVFHGSKPGPVLCITAALHGDEVNGVEIVRQLVKKKFLKNLAGTVIAAPIVNIYGFLQQERYLLDRRDLNRCFPGSETGSLTSRLAFLIIKELVSKSTHIIDLHTGSLHRENLPQIRASFILTEVSKMAKIFNSPLIIQSKTPEGSLRRYANDNNIPMIVYEGGEALRFSEPAIKHGLNGILNVMQSLKMIPAQPKKNKEVLSVVALSAYWVRATEGGLLRPLKTLGKRVRAGEVLAIIASPSSHHEIKLIAPTAGIIIGMNNLPLLHEGAATYHIATFEELNIAEQNIDNIQENIEMDENLTFE